MGDTSKSMAQGAAAGLGVMTLCPPLGICGLVTPKQKGFTVVFNGIDKALKEMGREKGVKFTRVMSGALLGVGCVAYLRAGLTLNPWAVVGVAAYVGLFALIRWLTPRDTYSRYA